MAMPWLTLLKAVPWTDVIARAPDIADGARRLWQRAAGGKGAASGTEASTLADVAPPTADEATRLRWELDQLRRQTGELQLEMRASSELIQALADQQARLIAQIEANRAHVRRLTWAVAALAVLAVAGWVRALT